MISELSRTSSGLSKKGKKLARKLTICISSISVTCVVRWRRALSKSVQFDWLFCTWPAMFCCCACGGTTCRITYYRVPIYFCRSILAIRPCSAPTLSGSVACDHSWMRRGIHLLRSSNRMKQINCPLKIKSIHFGSKKTCRNLVVVACTRRDGTCINFLNIFFRVAPLFFFFRFFRVRMRNSR